MIITKALSRLAENALAVYVADLVFAGFSVVGGFWAYVVVGLMLSVVNFFIKPLVKVISLPFIFVTFGLFVVVINALLLWLVVWLLQVLHLGEISLVIDSVLTYIMAAVIMSVFHFVVSFLFK
jgi:putative membrane protein